ncbi:hypothetical protein ACVW1B_004716 [Bradyrhizobium sp. USDA 4502]
MNGHIVGAVHEAKRELKRSFDATYGIVPHYRANGGWEKIAT